MLYLCSVIASAFCLLYIVEAKCPANASDPLPDLVFLGIPNNNCIKGKDGSKCDIFLRMAPNKENRSYTDFYMEGSLSGWVAVGFSLDNQMFATDVLGCKHFEDGSLSILNTWNVNIQPKHNVIDPSQDYMCNYSIKYEDKRIKCHFSRYSGIINEGFDYNLNGSYYIILGHSDSQKAYNGLPFHTTVTPVVTKAQINVYNYSSSNTSNGTNEKDAVFKEKMKKAHGSLMSLSWLLLSSSGIFFAMWMKPVFVNGLWFQIHRSLMIAGVITEVAGFICIFVATKDNKIPGLIGFECPKETVHFVFGLLLTGAMLANPVLGFLRCKPESSRRWIFNVVHASLGTGAFILALINIATGLSLFQDPCGAGQSTGSYPMVQLYMGWLGFFVLAHFIMFGLFTFFAIKSHGKERYELAPTILKPILRRMDDADYVTLNTGGNGVEKTDVSAKDSVFRTAAFGIYSAVNIVSVAILITMIGST